MDGLFLLYRQNALRPHLQSSWQDLSVTGHFSGNSSFSLLEFIVDSENTWTRRDKSLHYRLVGMFLLEVFAWVFLWISADFFLGYPASHTFPACANHYGLYYN